MCFLQSWNGANDAFHNCCPTPMSHSAEPCRPPFLRGGQMQGMMPRGAVVRGPFMPSPGMYRMPMAPRIGGPRPAVMEEEAAVGTGVKRRRGAGGGSRTRKRAKASDDSQNVATPPSPANASNTLSATVPSFLDDPNAYLAQQTAMLNSTMAGGPGQFSPQGSAAFMRQQRPTDIKSSDAVVDLVSSGAFLSPKANENISTSLPPTSSHAGSDIYSDEQVSLVPTSLCNAVTSKSHSSSTSSAIPKASVHDQNMLSISLPSSLSSQCHILSTTMISTSTSISASVSLAKPSNMQTTVSSPSSNAALVNGGSASESAASQLNTRKKSPTVLSLCDSVSCGPDSLHSSSNIPEKFHSHAVNPANTSNSTLLSSKENSQIKSGGSQVAVAGDKVTVSSSGKVKPVITSPRPMVDSSECVGASNKTVTSSVVRPSYSHSAGTEMLAIRSRVLRASPTSNFDTEKPESPDTDAGEEDDASNGTSDADENSCSSASTVPISQHSVPGQQSTVDDDCSRDNSCKVATSQDNTHSKYDNDASNKPLSPGPISSTCSQTPLEMVQNIVSSLPMPPACSSVSAFSPDCVSCTVPSSAVNTRHTPPFISHATSAAHPTATITTPLHHNIYDGVVRSGILVQQQPAVSTNSVVVVGAKHASHVTSLNALQPMQPLVHLVNPFPPSTPLIIQQTTGINNIGSISNIGAICSNAQLLPTSAPTFVTTQQAGGPPVVSRTPLPLSSSSPQLQVAQVVTTDGLVDGAISPSGSSTVSTPHATPPDPSPSPQPIRKRRRRRNSSASQAPVSIVPTLIVATQQQQQLVVAGGQQRYTTQASAGPPHVVTSATGGNVMTASPATAINVVQMVGPSMAGTLTAAPLQPPAILVGSGAPPGVILPSDAAFLSTDPNTCLTYPVQIVGVTAPATQQMVTMRPPAPDGSKVVTCLSSPPSASNNSGGVRVYTHTPSQAVVNTRNLAGHTALLASDYLAYQQHVFMQQPLVAKTNVTAISPQQAAAVITAGQQPQLSSSSSCADAGHSVSISTQTLLSEGENCDVSSTGDVQQCSVSAAASVSPKSPSHQSAEVTTTRLDEEPQRLRSPNKAPDSASEANTSPNQGELTYPFQS